MNLTSYVAFNIFFGTKLPFLLTKFIIDGDFDSVFIRYEDGCLDSRTLAGLDESLKHHKSINWIVETMAFKGTKISKFAVRRDRMLEVDFVSSASKEWHPANKAIEHEIVYVVQNPNQAVNIQDQVRSSIFNNKTFVIVSVDGDSIESYIVVEYKHIFRLTNSAEQNVYRMDFFLKYVQIHLLLCWERFFDDRVLNVDKNFLKPTVYFCNFLAKHLPIRTHVLYRPDKLVKYFYSVEKIQEHMVYDELVNFELTTTMPISLLLSVYM